MFSPVFHFDSTAGLWIGGQFLDGRATGDITGDPLADQALNPFLNPVEMANSSKSEVVRDVLNSEYEELFIDECGEPNMSSDSDIDESFQCIAEAIGDFERTWQFAQFNSKYDAYLRKCVSRGRASDRELDKCAKGIGLKAKIARRRVFTNSEWKGLKLF